MGYGGAILMGHSKSFDTLDHDLLIEDTTVHACDTNLESLMKKLECDANHMLHCLNVIL